MKKGWKILLWVVGIVLALLLIVSLLAGPIAKGYINGHGEELTGRKVAVDHVGVNLFSGNVCVRDLAVYEDNGEDVFVGFDTLDVSVRLLKIPFKTLHFGHITLAGLHANVEQEGKRFNFTSLLDHFASDSTAEKDTTPSDWTMKFYNIRISHASINYDDILNHKGMHLPDINLRVPGFVLGGDEGSEGGLTIGFDKGGHLKVDASMDNKENSYHVDVALDEFALQNLDSYLADMLRYEELDGSVSANLTADGRVDDILKSRIGGTVAVNGVALTGEKGPVAGFDALTVKINNINLYDNQYDIDEVRLGGLNAVYAQWKDYSNISLLLPKKEQQGVTLQSGLDDGSQAEVQEPEKKEASKPMQLHVGRIRIEDAAVTYDDYTLPDDFHFPVTGLNITADDLTTAGGNNAQVRATLPGGGHLMVRWKGDIVNIKNYQDLFLTIKGLDMKQLSPWAVAYTGYPIEDGIFGLTTRLNITNSNLDNQNKIDIFKAKVGDKRKDVDAEVKIPLKAALYILKDKDDKILIDMPVKGNVDNPEFNYMKVVWKTLGNLLVKVATSPARALGSALGINGDELEFMAVEADQHGLTSEQYHILSDLATIAMSDPKVTITLTQHMPASDDEEAGKRAEWLNEQVRRYIAEQGVPEGRIVVVTGESLADPKAKAGYAITSEMNIED